MTTLTIIHSVLLALNFLIFFAVLLQIRASAKKGSESTNEVMKDNQEWKAEVRARFEALTHKNQQP